jgi:hypothetical protein
VRLRVRFLRLSSTSCRDGGGAQHIRWMALLPISQSFRLSKVQRPYMLSAPVDLGPMGAQAHGNELGWPRHIYHA